MGTNLSRYPRVLKDSGQPGKIFRLSAKLSGRARTLGSCHERRRCEVPRTEERGGGMYMFSLIYLGFPAICHSSTHLFYGCTSRGNLQQLEDLGRTTGDLQTRKGCPHAFQVGFCDGQPLKSITERSCQNQR